MLRIRCSYLSGLCTSFLKNGKLENSSSKLLKGFALAITFIFTLFPSSAQELDLDSLDRVLELVSGQEKIQIQMDLMEAVVNQDKERAIQMGEEVRTSREFLLIDGETTGKFLYRLAHAYLKLSQDDSASSIVNELKSDFADSDGPYHLANVIEGSLLEKEGENKVAIEVYEVAKDFFEKEGDKRMEAYTSTNIANVQYQIGNYDLALASVDNALELYEKITDASGIANALKMKGGIVQQLGEVDNARALFEQSMKICDQIGDNLTKASLLNQLGILNARQSRYEEAIDQFSRAKELNKKLGNNDSYVLMLNNLGVVSNMMGEYDDAMKFYAQVVEASDSLDMTYNKALAQSNIGLIYQNLLRYEEAYEILQNSLAIFREMDNKPNVSRVLNNLGNVARSLDKRDEALGYYEESLTIKKEIGRQSTIGVTLTSIAGLHIEMENYDQAEKYLKEALQIRKDQKDKSGLVASYLGISQLLKSRGMIHEAVLFSDSALTIANEIGALLHLKDLHEHRVKLFTALEQFDKALQAHIGFKAASDSIFSTENESVVSEIEQRYKTKEQQQEINLLQKAKEIQNLWVIGLVVGVALLLIVALLFYNRYRLKNRSNKIIQEKSDELEQSNVQLKDLSEFRHGMTNMIAHDIKNPLNSIINLSQKLNGKSADDISRAGNVIFRLLTNMLDVEKFENASPKLELQKGLLSDLIAEAELAVELLLHDKSVRLKVVINQDAELLVDREMMLRVFVNLLSNAIKFSPSNSEIVIETNAIRETEKVKISFSDSGLGIPKEDQPYIFEKYYQSEAKRSGMTPSTGLGLTFCKLALNAHNGEIEVVSEKNQGSTFTITLNGVRINGSNKEEFSHKEFEIGEKDRLQLKDYSDQLKELKVYNISTIMEILDEIESRQLQPDWVSEVRSAVQHANRDEYMKLVEMI